MFYKSLNIIVILVGLFSVQPLQGSSAREQERSRIHQQHNLQADQVSQEYRRAMHAHLFEKKPYPGSVAQKFVEIERERAKKIDQLEALPSARAVSSAQVPINPRESARVTVESGKSFRTEAVIDGSKVPKEIEFPGKQKSKPSLSNP